ncbi:MAG: formate dehydrogenase accessory sulfurtransferase FdhD [Clostridia bacterium]|nr:formate dehydrogenase accessory sulfurtransferase FdhD [Clostridia bacterium]
MNSRTATHKVNRLTSETMTEMEDYLVKESPLTVHYNDIELVTLLCTPEYMEDLGLGFLYSEGLLKDYDNVVKIKVDEEKGIIWIESNQTDLIAEKLFLKRYITTGCGKGTTFYNVMDSALVKNIDSPLTITGEQIFKLMKEFQHRSELFQETGGVHSCALSDGEKLLIFREDIGRHNALDKIVGNCFRERTSLVDKIILTSGRISSEILLKVAKMGVSTVVSRSAPTDLAVKIGDELGVTIVGFVRGNRMNIYTHPQRIKE